MLAADGSVVTEPGAVTSTRRLHYVMDISTLRCEEAQVTAVKHGESLTRFAVQKGDVLQGIGGLPIGAGSITYSKVELAFKRMKSLLGLSRSRKKDPEGAQAWLQGKLLVACLIERLIAVGEHFPLSRIRNAKENVTQRRCLWREMAFFHWLLCSMINTYLSLFACLEKWERISQSLRESPRKKRGLPAR